MKSMKDFKGGDYEFRRDGNMVYSLYEVQLAKTGVTVPTNYVYASVYADYRIENREEVTQANAKLFAASKKLLEAAIEVVYGHSIDPGSLHHKIHSLEQAINEAL